MTLVSTTVITVKISVKDTALPMSRSAVRIST